MEQLARLEDLPQTYIDHLTESNLVPLWPSLRNVLPPRQPVPLTQATAWHYRDIKPLLLEAGELTPIEKAERRVLVLANPGHGLENMKATSSIYLGMQLLLPNEWAPSHRHTPNAVRLVVEGQGAFTTVEGQKCRMEHGDLILTPSGLWHEHGHDGDEPVIWLDVLDLPLVYYMEASYVEGGDVQQVQGTDLGHHYAKGVVPTVHFVRQNANYPMLRYAWTDTKNVLDALATDANHQAPAQVSFINPETAQDCQNIIGYSAIRVAPNETVQLTRRSAAQVFHVIEGQLSITVNSDHFDLVRSDTACAPCFAQIDLINRSEQPAYVFVADEAPLQKKLGLYSTRPRSV